MGEGQKDMNYRRGLGRSRVALTFLAIAFGIVPRISSAAESNEVRILVQGDTGLLPNFVDNLRRQLKEDGLSVKLAERDGEYEYNVVLAQESTLGSAAAAVIVLDRKGNFVMSVVRSGRFSGKGAFNASAKEIAKKIAILRGVH